MKNQSRKNINFRETKSERSATDSYRGFGRYRKSLTNKIKSIKPS